MGGVPHPDLPGTAHFRLGDCGSHLPGLARGCAREGVRRPLCAPGWPTRLAAWNERGAEKCWARRPCAIPRCYASGWGFWLWGVWALARAGFRWPVLISGFGPRGIFHRSGLLALPPSTSRRRFHDNAPAHQPAHSPNWGRYRISDIENRNGAMAQASAIQCFRPDYLAQRPAPMTSSRA